MDPPPHTTAQGFDALYGLRISEFEGGCVRAEVEVREALKQADGRVHGGVYASLAESLASFGTAAGAISRGAAAIPESNQMSFLRSITEGTIHASARAVHRGRTTWVWEVEISDDQQQLCALARMTVALRS
jgi:1,4-dihydroxy-2-naphthoyl-CoA hydrolase